MYISHPSKWTHRRRKHYPENNMQLDGCTENVANQVITTYRHINCIKKESRSCERWLNVNGSCLNVHPFPIFSIGNRIRFNLSLISFLCQLLFDLSCLNVLLHAQYTHTHTYTHDEECNIETFYFSIEMKCCNRQRAGIFETSFTCS